MNIIELTYISYLFTNPEMRCALSDYYMQIVDAGGGQAFAVLNGSDICAYAVLINEGRGKVLSYICTDPNERRKGYATQLLCKIVEDSEFYIRLHILRAHPSFEAMHHMAKAAGFMLHDISNVYTCPVNEQLWHRMDELKLHKMKELFLRDGSVCKPFIKLNEVEFEQLRNSGKSSFGNSLDTTVFTRTVSNEPSEREKAAGVPDYNLSFALFGKDGVLRAYTLVMHPTSENVCFEHIAEAKGDIGSGSVITPLCASLERIREDASIKRMMLTISERNERSMSFTLKILKNQNLTRLQNYSLVAASHQKKNEQVAGSTETKH